MPEARAQQLDFVFFMIFRSTFAFFAEVDGVMIFGQLAEVIGAITEYLGTLTVEHHVHHMIASNIEVHLEVTRM